MSLKSVADKVSAIFQSAAPVAGAIAAVSPATSPIAAIADIVLAIPTFIATAETLVSDAGVPVSGPQKLAAVKAAILAGFNEISPALANDFDKAWGIIGPVISMIVTLAKFGIKF